MREVGAPAECQGLVEPRPGLASGLCRKGQKCPARASGATTGAAAACIACAWLCDRVSDQTTLKAITRVAKASGTGLAWHGPAGC